MSLVSSSANSFENGNVEYTPVMLSAAAKAARATGRTAGRAAKNTMKIAVEAAGEIAKDAGLKTLKRPRGKIKVPGGSLGSVSGGSRVKGPKGRGPTMAARDEALKQRKEMLRRIREKEQNDALRRLKEERDERRRQSAAKMQEMMRM